MYERIIDITEEANKVSKHIHLSKDQWVLSKWKSKDFPFKSDSNLYDNMEKLWNELKNDMDNNKHTTTQPLQHEVKDNILALTGLTESAKRDTAETSTTVKWVGLGTGTTAEAESQTALVTELTGGAYTRKDLSVDGTRKVSSQTAKYGVAFDDGDVNPVPVTLREAGLFTLSAAGVMHARVLFSAFTINTGDLFVIQLSEQHANGTL